MRVGSGVFALRTLAFWKDNLSGRKAAAELAWVAQLVEHVLGKDEVAGSIPVPGSTARATHFSTTNQPKNNKPPDQLWLRRNSNATNRM